MMNLRTILFGLFMTVVGLIGCSSDSDSPGPGPDPAPPGNAQTKPISKNNRVIYEVNVRNYSATGNFAGLQKDLQRLKEVGVDILWLMPIHPIGEQNRGGTLGSPYSVKDYKAVNPAYGTLADLKSLVAAAHDLDMEVWLDWVANHTAWDHSWVSEHIDYYAEKNGQRPYSPENWTDVAQLDFNNPDLCAAMIDAMQYWVREADIDGYRCDAVTYVPLSFWKQARPEVDKVKPITWLAEGDKAEYMEVFDYDYAWGFNNDLNDFGKNKDVSKLIEACEALYNNVSYTSKGRMVYLTNHDLNAYDGTEFTRYNNSVLPLTVLYFTIYDMPLLYNGQEIGMNKTMGLFDANPVAWSPVNQTMSNLITQLTYLKRTQPALEGGAGRGTLTHYATTSNNVYAYSRKKGNSEVVVLLNLTNASVSFRFNGQIPSGEFSDYLGSTGNQTFTTQTTISLPANGYAVYIK